jgi:CPA2 family monovalent cation:H+ antiporter-2
VFAISRGVDGVVTPTGREALRAHDVLVLSGTHDAVEAAKAILSGGRQAQPGPASADSGANA